MFGVKAGEERFQGKLNQFVVSKLTARDESKSYWVFHTRGEDATSILISGFSKLKIAGDDVIPLVQGLTVHTLSALEWAAVKVQQESGLIVYAWGSKETKIKLHDAVANQSAVSCVLGYEKGPHEESAT